MLAQDAKNVWLIDLMTDIDLGQKRAPQAIARLQAASAAEQQPSAAAQHGQCLCRRQPAGAGLEDLNRYTFAHPDDPNGWDLLAQASAAEGCAMKSCRPAPKAALTGRLDQAIGLLSNTSSLQKLGSLKQARYDARDRPAAPTAAALPPIPAQLIQQGMNAMKNVTIYHNPRCSKSRETRRCWSSTVSIPRWCCILKRPRRPMS